MHGYRTDGLKKGSINFALYENDWVLLVTCGHGFVQLK